MEQRSTSCCPDVNTQRLPAKCRNSANLLVKSDMAVNLKPNLGKNVLVGEFPLFPDLPV